MNRLYLIVISIPMIALSSCVKTDDKKDDFLKEFNDLTSRFYLIEESNRLELKKSIEGF